MYESQCRENGCWYRGFKGQEFFVTTYSCWQEAKFQLNCWRVKELERSTVRLEQGQNWKRKNCSYYTWQKNFHSTIDSVKWAVSRNSSKFKHWKLPPNWVKHENNRRKALEEGINNRGYKRTHGWPDKLWKKIKTDWKCGFWKLVSLTVFQSSFVLLVTFDIICLARSCGFVTHQ